MHDGIESPAAEEGQARHQIGWLLVVVDVPDGRNPDPIPQNGVCAPDVSKGLHWPGFQGPGKTDDKTLGVQVNKRAYYWLDIPAAPVLHVNTNGGSKGATTAALDVCGIVDPGFAGIGAACGSSTGHSGRGKLVFTNGTVYDLTNVGWPATLIPGTLAVYGHIQEVTGTGKKTKVDTKGYFQGLIKAFGGVDCFDSKPGAPPPPGATSFTVGGVVFSAALLK